MKTYKFEYLTTINYSLPVDDYNFLLKCVPSNNTFQRIYDEKIIIEPVCSYSTGRDSFGNITLNGRGEDGSVRFTFGVKGKALISKYKLHEDLDRIYLYPGKMTDTSDKLTEFFKTITKSDDVHTYAENITMSVNNYMQYVKGATDCNTTAAQAFELGKGVCQDYAQIAIVLFREAGIPARYCTGLMEGEGETHAWVEYYDNGTWYGADPTNAKMIDYGYIKIGHGRDSYDCTIDRGCFVCPQGIVEQKSDITVKVGEIQ